MHSKALTVVKHAKPNPSNTGINTAVM